MNSRFQKTIFILLGVLFLYGITGQHTNVPPGARMSQRTSKPKKNGSTKRERMNTGNTGTSSADDLSLKVQEAPSSFTDRVISASQNLEKRKQNYEAQLADLEKDFAAMDNKTTDPSDRDLLMGEIVDTMERIEELQLEIVEIYAQLISEEYQI